jgi:hypothetical protein
MGVPRVRRRRDVPREGVAAAGSPPRGRVAAPPADALVKGYEIRAAAG